MPGTGCNPLPTRGPSVARPRATSHVNPVSSSTTMSPFSRNVRVGSPIGRILHGARVNRRVLLFSAARTADAIAHTLMMVAIPAAVAELSEYPFSIPAEVSVGSLLAIYHANRYRLSACRRGAHGPDRPAKGVYPDGSAPHGFRHAGLFIGAQFPRFVRPADGARGWLCLDHTNRCDFCC